MGRLQDLEREVQPIGGRLSGPSAGTRLNSSQPQSNLFTNKDPKAILDSLLGFVPGASEVQSAYEPKIDNQERIKRVMSGMQKGTPQGVGSELLKGLAGIPVRAGLSITDLFGGPKQANVPFLGPQQSYQQTARGLKQEGAGPVVSTAIPAVQALMDLFGAGIGKKMLSKPKAAVPEPVTARPQQKLLPAPIKEAIPMPAVGQRLPFREAVQPNLTEIQPPTSNFMYERSGQQQAPISKSFSMPTGREGALTETLMKFLSPEGKNEVRAKTMAGAMEKAGLPYDKTMLETILGLTKDKTLSSLLKREVQRLATEQGISPRVPLQAQGGVPPQVLPKFAVEEPYIQRQPQSQVKPSAIPKPKGDVETQKILDQLTGVEEKPLNRVQKVIYKVKESNRILAESPEGMELVRRGRRAQHTQNRVIGELSKISKESNISKLSDKEWLNFRDVMERKAQPISDNVTAQVQIWKPVFEKYGQQTGVNMMENYYPRRINDAGRVEYELPQNKEMVIENIMKDRNIGRTEAVKLVQNGLHKGSFEFERALKDVPSKFRKTPREELAAWQDEVARRIGTIQEFGKTEEIANNLIDRMGIGKKNEFKIKGRARKYLDRLTGNIDDTSAFDPFTSKLNDAFVISKLDPTTTLNNALQGHAGAWMKYGNKGLRDATFGKEGMKMVDELGLNKAQAKIGSENQAGSWANTYMKAIGMQEGGVIPKTLTETGNYARAGQASYGAITRAFETLKKNPLDREAYTLLKRHSMFVNDVELAKALKKGEIPNDEMLLGVAEGVRQTQHFQLKGERPTWANSGLGKSSYIFKNYILSQMELLSEMPLHRQLPYLLVIAPLMGLPYLVIRRAIQGKPLPDNPADLYVQSAMSGPGTPFDIINMASSDYRLLNTILGSLSTPYDIATSNNKLKSIIGGFGPSQKLYLNRLFPPKQ